MTTISASQVLTPDGWWGPSRLKIDGGRIVSIESVPRASERILTAGFVDLQVNGIDDIDVSQATGADWERLDELLLAQGVTTWCPTLVTAPLPRYDRPLAEIAAAMRRDPAGRPLIAGAHLEGPFLGAAPGAHPPEWIVDCDLAWLAALPPHVRVVTLGAEQPDAVAAIRLLVERGVLVSVGHSRPTIEQFDAAVSAGARLVTHLFNGMSGVHHRDPGLAALALAEPGICASLIADGVHVHPRVLRMAAATLGDRAVLVTDAVAWRTGSVGGVGLAARDGAPRLPDGTLAGSAVTMDAAVRCLVAAGVDLADALRAASATPARLLGLHDRGTIAPGQLAHLVALSDTTAEFRTEVVHV